MVLWTRAFPEAMVYEITKDRSLKLVGVEYIVPDKLTIWQAASAHESLLFIFIGVVIVLPTILAYTFFSYRVFRGKVRELHYG